MKLSIIIPAFNEEENVRPLYDKLVKDLKDNQINDYQIIFIDDGSSDNTFKELEDLLDVNSSLLVIKFRRNFGKSSALSVGFEKASGDIIITMDADMQDDSKEIPRFVEKIKEGYDLVNGWKARRKDPRDKVLPSRVFNYIVAKVFNSKLHDHNCGFKAYTKNVLDELEIYGDMHRFIPILALQKGFKITEIPVEHHPRRHGVSKYDSRRFLSGIFDLITIFILTKYLRKPLHIFGVLGGSISILSSSVILFLYLRKFLFGILIGPGRPFVLLSIVGVAVGLQILIFGILAEMLIKLSFNKERNYSIEKIVGKTNK